MLNMNTVIINVVVAKSTYFSAFICKVISWKYSSLSVHNKLVTQYENLYEIMQVK